MSIPPSPLLTDLYQLTMAQGYLRSRLAEREACFELFFRRHPFHGGYSVIAGVEEAARFLEGLRFRNDDLAYLESLGLFRQEFLDRLSRLRFTGDLWAVAEGSLAFPLEPILRVQAPLEECQLVESALLNMVNFQSLIATKAARVCQEAGEGNVMEFGLRRAQGTDGALTASRAAYLGGCASTSNLLAGKTWGIPVGGTHAHSWVMAFPDELAAFRAFVEVYPRNATLLVDTFDTLRSGIPNAIQVAREMRTRGQNLGGIRLDSGDLAYLSIEARRMLDEAGFPDVRIVCSSDLDEHIIHDLRSQGARIDVYGVGTRLVSGDGEPAFSGVFKMVALRSSGGSWEPKVKISEGGSKSTLPGIKQVWRLLDGRGEMMADWMEMFSDPESKVGSGPGEAPDFSRGLVGYHPVLTYQNKRYDGISAVRPLLLPLIRRGKITAPLPSLEESRRRLQAELRSLHPTMRRLLNPHVYKISIGPKLRELTERLRGAGSAG